MKMALPIFLSSFPPSKGRTMKCMRYVAWGVGTVPEFFSFKYVEMWLITTLLQFFSKVAFTFDKDNFSIMVMRIYLDVKNYVIYIFLCIFMSKMYIFLCKKIQNGCM